MYVTSMSLWLDLRILVATAMKVIGVPFPLTSRCLALPGVLPPLLISNVPSEHEQESVPHLLTA